MYLVELIFQRIKNSEIKENIKPGNKTHLYIRIYIYTYIK